MPRHPSKDKMEVIISFYLKVFFFLLPVLMAPRSCRTCADLLSESIFFNLVLGQCLPPLQNLDRSTLPRISK